MPDEARFPQFTPELCEAMKQETILGFESLLREDGSLLRLIDSRETWLNETLAEHYGIDGVQGPEMRRVRLDGHPQRGGLLGMASVLTATSGPTPHKPRRPRHVGARNPARRDDPRAAGRCRHARSRCRRGPRQDAPGGAPPHRRNRSCAACHDKIDPIGFGLENFDAIGRYRTEEAGRPIDSTGELPGGATFRGPVELKRMLARTKPGPFVRNVTERLLSFALGRKLEAFDEPTLREITSAVEDHGRGAATLIKEIVRSYPFQSQNNRSTPSNSAPHASPTTRWAVRPTPYPGVPRCRRIGSSRDARSSAGLGGAWPCPTSTSCTSHGESRRPVRRGPSAPLRVHGPAQRRLSSGAGT